MLGIEPANIEMRSSKSQFSGQKMLVQLENMRTDLQKKKLELRSMTEQIAKCKKKRQYYMREFLRIESDKHSYSVIVLKDLLNHTDLVKTRQKFKAQFPNVKPG